MPTIQPLKGFRDFLPSDAIKRLWLKNRLVDIFTSWGFAPMETPTLEPLELFEGQIGEDEKLFFKFKDNGGRDVALRYDQTVPTCRIVGANFQTLGLPFKRYQIQNAFRAENTQRGRFREFTQCDADIFGTTSPYADAELIALSLDIYRQLGFKEATVSINDRDLLKDIPYSAIVAIDKLEKIGEEGVISEMQQKNISPSQAREILRSVRNLKPSSKLNIIFDYLKKCGFPESWYQFQPTLSRSFSYSTGPIWEVKIPNYPAGSVLGGERFDQLVQKISSQNIPGTGFGLGFDRTLDACEQMNLIPQLSAAPQVLVTIFSPELFEVSLKLSLKLRQKGINVELYPDPTVKLEKQLKYASKKQTLYAIIIGPDESKKELYKLKNIQSFDQQLIDYKQLVKILSK